MKPARREAYFSCLEITVEHSINFIELLCRAVLGPYGRYNNFADGYPSQIVIRDGMPNNLLKLQGYTSDDAGLSLCKPDGTTYRLSFIKDGGLKYGKYFNGVWTGVGNILTNADMRDYICTQTAGQANYTLSILPIIFGRVVVLRLNNVVCQKPATSLTLVSNNAPTTNRGVSAVLCDSTGSGDTMRAIYGIDGEISLIGGTAGKTYFGEIITISQLDV